MKPYGHQWHAHNRALDAVRRLGEGGYPSLAVDDLKWALRFAEKWAAESAAEAEAEEAAREAGSTGRAA